MDIEKNLQTLKHCTLWWLYNDVKHLNFPLEADLQGFVYSSSISFAPLDT